MHALRSRGGCSKILSEPRSRYPEPIAGSGMVEPGLPFVTLSTVIGQIAMTDILGKPWVVIDQQSLVLVVDTIVIFGSAAMCTGSRTVLLGYEGDQWWEDLDSMGSSETSSSREVRSGTSPFPGILALDLYGASYSGNQWNQTSASTVAWYCYRHGY